MKFDCSLMIKKRKENRYFTKTMVNNHGGHDLNGSFDTLRLPKRLMDSPPTAAYADTKESPTRLGAFWTWCITEQLVG